MEYTCMTRQEGKRSTHQTEPHVQLLVCRVSSQTGVSLAAYLYARCLHLRGRVGWLAHAHDANHVLLLEFSNVQVQVVRLGRIHNNESELPPLNQGHLSRHGALDPAYGSVGGRGPGDGKEEKEHITSLRSGRKMTGYIWAARNNRVFQVCLNNGMPMLAA